MTNLTATQVYTAQEVYDIQESIDNGDLEVVEVTQEYLDDLSMAAFLDQLYKD